MDCFFPLFLVRVAIPKHGGCSTSVGAPSWQGNRERERKSPGKSLRQHHRPPWVSIAAFTLECKGSTELSSLPAAGIGLQPWLAPGSEGHLVPACAAGEERGLFPPGRVVRFKDTLPAHPQEGEENVSTRPLLSWRVQGEKSKVASSTQQRAR